MNNANRNNGIIRTLTLAAATAGTLASATSALAAPTVYPVPNNRLDEVVNQSGSNVFGDSVDPDVLWVMPPTEGVTTTSGHLFSGNVGYCESMELLQDASKSVVRRLKRLADDLGDYEQELADALDEVNQARADRDALLTEEDAYGLFDQLDEEIEDLKEQVETLKEEVEDCDEDVTDCDELSDELKDTKKTLKARKRELRKERKKHRKAWRKYKRASKKLKSAKERYDELEAEFAKKLGRYSSLKQDLDAMYAQYAVLEGGFANIEYRSGWEDAVAQLQKDNPSFYVQKIPTKEARLNMTLVPGLGSENYLASLPMVLNYSLAGKNYDPNDAVLEFPALPDNLGANVRLSLIGACPAAYPEKYDISTDNKGSALFGLVASYAYPSVFRVKATATFNMWSMYEIMKKNWRKGGFFSTKTGSSTVEKDYKGSVFNLTFDSDSELSPEDKKEIRAEILSGINQQILTTLGFAVHDPQSPELALATAPENGAVVFARGIKKTCGFNIYCKGASWILHGLSATFGSTRNEASFKSTHNVSVTRRYSESEIQYRYGVIGYNRGEESE